MNELNLIATAKTPGIFFDINTQTLKLSGRSIPENAADFYSQVFTWLEEHLNNVNSKQCVEVRLEYFNTSSSKSILDIFRKYQKAKNDGRCDVLVIWFYESDDEDMLEAGQDYGAITGLRFEYRPESNI